MAPLPVPGTGCLDLSWEGLSLLLGMVAREGETHSEWRLGGEGAEPEPSGKPELAGRLTGHLGEMRAGRDWGGGSRGSLIPLGIASTLEQLLGIVAVREQM